MVWVGGENLDRQIPNHRLDPKLGWTLPLTAPLLLWHSLLVQPFPRGDELKVEEVGDAADRGGEGGRQGEGDGEGHVALRVAKAHLVVARMSDNLISLICFHSVSLLYAFH